MNVRLRRNTDAEEAAIQRGIAADPDSPELTDEFFANNRPASEVLPPEMYAELIQPAQRGLGKQR